MKILSLILVLLLGSVALCTTGFADGVWFDYGLSVQFSGQQSGAVGVLSLTTPIDVGVAFEYELVYQAFSYVEVGVGFQQQFFRSMTLYTGSFAFYSPFAILRIPVQAGPIVLYPLGRIGYGFFLGDADYRGAYGSLTGGLYYAVGAGMRSPDFVIDLWGKSLNHVFIEATYQSNSGLYSDSYYGLTVNVTYTAWNIYLVLQR